MSSAYRATLVLGTQLALAPECQTPERFPAHVQSFLESGTEILDLAPAVLGSRCCDVHDFDSTLDKEYISLARYTTGTGTTIRSCLPLSTCNDSDQLSS
jgi:hypothetical protein